MEKRYAISSSITGREIQSKRKELGMTQKQFATLLGISKPTMERYEADKDKVYQGPIAIAIASLSKEYLKEKEVPDNELPLRLWYMYKNHPCTVIDVDDCKQKVSIHNYAENVMFRAFGINEKPTYEDYQEFLSSRCFPATRDKMKIILKDLGLPFYDPFLIIQKTKGEMAEDDFWIRIEQ